MLSTDLSSKYSLVYFTFYSVFQMSTPRYQGMVRERAHPACLKIAQEIFGSTGNCRQLLHQMGSEYNRSVKFDMIEDSGPPGNRM